MYVETKTDPFNVYEKDVEPVKETCEEPLKESELQEIYADAFYEESHGYANEDHERQTIQDEEALMEILAEDDRAEREMEERIRQDREIDDLLCKIDYGIAEMEDFGNYRYETNWDVLLKTMKGPIH